MARRYVIDPEEAQQAALQPVASPVDTFVPAPLQAPVMQEILDLAPLSRSFMGLASVVVEGEQEKAYKSGGVAFSENKQDLIQAFSSGEKTAAEKLASLARSKEIPEHYIPQFYKGIYELAAEEQMNRYQGSLKDKIDSYSQVVDKDGNFLPEPVQDADQIASDVWNKSFANSPIFQNFYAQQVAAKVKNTIDSNWRSAATSSRALKLKEWQVGQLGGLLGSQMDAASRTGDFKEVDMTVQRLREYGVPDLQQTFAGAVVSYVGSLQARALRSSNPEERAKLIEDGKRILTSMDDVKFAGASLRDNSSISTLVDKAFLELEGTHDRITREALKNRDYETTQRAYKLIDEEMKKNTPEDQIKPTIKAKLIQYNYGAEATASILNTVDAYLSAAEVGSNSNAFTSLMLAANEGRMNPDSWTSAVNLALTSKEITAQEVASLNSAFNNARARNTEQIDTEFNSLGSTPDFDSWSTLPENQSIARVAQNAKQALESEFRQALVDSRYLPQEKQNEAKKAAAEKYRNGITSLKKGLLVERTRYRSLLQDLKANVTPEDLGSAASYLPDVEYRMLIERREDYNKFNQFVKQSGGPALTNFQLGLKKALAAYVDSNVDPAKATLAHDAFVVGTLYPVGNKAYKDAMDAGQTKDSAMEAASLAMSAEVAKTDSREFRTAFGLEGAVEKLDAEAANSQKIRQAGKTIYVLNKELNDSWFYADETRIREAINYDQPGIGDSNEEITSNNEKFDELVTSGLQSTVKRFESNYTAAYYGGALVVLRHSTAPITARNNTYDSFSKAWSGGMLTSTERNSIATSLSGAFGMTEQEALSGSIKEGSLINALVDPTKVNPYSTPMFVDKFTAMGSAAFEEWIRSDSAGPSITRLITKYTKADPNSPEAVEIFIQNQIKAHLVRYKNYAR